MSEVDKTIAKISHVERISPQGEVKANGDARSGTDRPLVARQFKWIPPELIPPRRFLFEHRHAIIGHVSLTGATGGTGKSSFLISEALAHKTGRNLLGDRPLFCGNPWYLGFEDDIEEHTRRVEAAALLHKIDPAVLADGFFVNDVTETFIIAHDSGNGVTVIEPKVQEIMEQIERRKITYLMVDPFVASHNVRENDNGAIDMVARQWVRIASQAKCAIDLTHHLRKANGVNTEPSADDFRGASSLVPVVRSARLFRTMTQTEAKGFGVDDHPRYFAISDVKRNMAARAPDVAWCQLTAINLRNGGDGPSDHVAAAERWVPPDASDAATFEQIEEIKNRVSASNWRKSSQAKDWVGKCVADVLNLDVLDDRARDSVKRLIRTWLEDGTFREVERLDDQRHLRNFIAVSDGP